MESKYEAEPRDILGKKVKNLRNNGIVPANIYGKGIDSIAVQMPYSKVKTMLNSEGINGYIELDIDGEKSSRAVIIRAVTRHPISRDVEHIDFNQVDQSTKIQANIPIVIIDEAPAVTENKAVLLNGIDTLQISALPGSLPKSIEVSVASLLEFDDSLFVSDIELDSSIDILSDPDSLVVKASAPRVAEEESPAGEEIEEGEEGVESDEATDSEDGDSSTDESSESDSN
ncbi:MAG: 50S ribosomal protein L25 [Chloroflexi bacterium]|nr:50S ribosomal protein L25 [Chloroflexota bacterium]|tara:strand:- start:7065 stop:7751 length:687 start_codon:yes stop_codon:yes gene_type:complete